ncbi:MAG: S1C family serine protease [Planctomycetaceae bacterium]
MRRFAVPAAFGAVLLGMLSADAAHAVDPKVLAAQKRRVEVAARVAPAVVAIFARGGRGGGSGVLITPDGYALTNFHVTRGAGTFMKCGLNDGKLYDAVIVGVDPTGDVALIKLLGRRDFPVAKLGDSDKLRAGDFAFAMGNPFLLATDFKPTVTYGIVSGVHRYQYPAGNDFLEYTDCIQIDTSINPGNSGGPLFNTRGELVGINGRGSFEKRGRVNSGAGYAISINQIKNFMGHLRSGRIVDHATLGASVETARDGSVVVSNILEQSEAFRRGLEIGDEIFKFGGRPMRSVNQYKNILGIYPKGWKVPLTYRRNNKEYTIYLRLRALHRSDTFTKKAPPKTRPKPRPGGKPIPIPRPRPKSAAPSKYKHLFVKRDGYANYYFNKLEQERALKGVKALGDFSKVAGKWTLSGKTGDGKAFEFRLDDVNLGLIDAGKPLLQQVDKKHLDIPRQTGGLLTAMHNLRLFLTHGRAGTAFPEFYYLGTEPLDGKGKQVDVIATEYINDSGKANIAGRWYFDPEDGRFLGFDTQLSEDVDECQVRFSSFKDFNGRKLPEKITVRHADKTFGTFTIEKVKLEAGTIKKGKPKNDAPKNVKKDAA